MRKSTSQSQFFKTSAASAATLLALGLSFAGADMALAQLGQPPQDLDQIEMKLLERSYPKEIEDQRLGRLEEFVFGVKRTGPLDARLKTLEKAIKMPEDVPALPTAQTKPAPAAQTKSTTAAAQGGKSAATATGTTGFPSYDYGKYPRVAELEKQWLGKTFDTDSLQQRVARLEVKLMGRTSPPGEDLCDRIDRLDELAGKMAPTEVPAGVPASSHYMRYSQQAEPQRDMADAQDSDKPKNPFAPGNEPPSSSIFQRTSIMERLVFGHDHGGQPLADRVKRLEKKLVPYEHNIADKDLTKRVSNLWSVLEAANEPER